MSETPNKSLTLETEELDPATVLRICGSVSISDADTLRNCLAELVAKEIPMIVLDLSKMDFICSTGLGAIIMGYLKSRHHKGQIRLANPQPAVRALLETTRLTKLFPLYSSVEEAVSS